MKLSKSGIFLIVVLVIAIGLGVWVAIMTCDVLAKDPITMPDRGSAAGTPRPVQNADKPKEPDTFVISMVGDCTLASIQTGRDFDSYIDKNGTSWPFSGVVDYLDQDEFTLANLECTFSDEKLKSSSLFYFRGPSSYADILVQGSVECATLGNNHTDDFGAKGVADTKAALDAVGVPWAAAGESKVITTEHGLKIGIYCPGWTGLSKSNITTGIQKLKEVGADILIFAPHWGTEGSYKVTANQESFAHAAIDAGAHIVFGTHPHVLQKMEAYNGGYRMKSNAAFEDKSQYLQYFSGGFNGLVMNEIREKRSMAYSAGAYIGTPALPGNPTYLFGNIGTQNDKANDALDVFMGLVTDMPKNADRIDNIKSYMRQEALTTHPSFRSKAETLNSLQRIGYSEDPAKENLPKIDALTFDDIVKFYEDNIKGKPYCIGIMGNPKDIDVKKLEKYGKVVRLNDRKLFNTKDTLF